MPRVEILAHDRKQPQILLRHGGVYVDVDFLCLGAFDDLHRRYEFYAGVSNTGTFELNNGLVG